MRWLRLALAFAGGLAFPIFGEETYLKTDAKTCKAVVLSMRVNGQVGGSMDFRVTSTDRAYNYKLRATWLTPEVIRCTARLVQLAEGLTDVQTRQLVEEAEAVRDTVILVEIDPREGSGIIPREWTAQLMPRGSDPSGPKAVRGTVLPKLRDVKALGGALQRDYAYDIFWVVFPLRLPDGQPLFSTSDNEAELVVRIYSKVGRVRWKIPDSIRQLAPAVAARE
jgi:hypothetical protein